MVTIKKYGNRRLYDMEGSRYVTLDELREKIRKGADVRVIDAKTDEDLTAATLTQILMEGKSAARMLPVPLLTQLVRMGDDALAEFFGRYVTWTLEMYLKMKQGAQQIAPFNPLVMAPFAATNAIARMFTNAADRRSPWEQQPQPSAAPPMEPPPTPMPPPPPVSDDVADLRRELAELKAMLQGSKKKRR
jgi:polyhydroxyalkanoate synthesis repressor PhaR